MGVRLYLHDEKKIALLLGFTEKDFENLKKYENLHGDGLPERIIDLRVFLNNGFGKFDLRLLKIAGFKDKNGDAEVCGSSKDGELGFALLKTTGFYNTPFYGGIYKHDWVKLFSEGFSWH